MTIAIATLKEQILAELDQLSVEALTETLAYVKAQRGSTDTGQDSAFLAPKKNIKINIGNIGYDSVKPGSTDTGQDSTFLAAYQRSKQKRSEVYRRLADS